MDRGLAGRGRALREDRARARDHAAAARGLTEFVGRENELETLSQALARAAAGRGQVIAIVGEAGVGKSRLIWEVTHSHRVQGWLVLQAGSVSYGKATSYLPVVDLLKGDFGIEDRDEPQTAREKLTGKLLTLDRALKSDLPALLSLLDVPTDDLQWSTLDPPQRRRRILDAVKRLLLRESQVQPAYERMEVRVAGAGEDLGGTLDQAVAVVAQHDTGAAARHQPREVELEAAQRYRAREQQVVLREDQLLAQVDDRELLGVA